MLFLVPSCLVKFSLGCQIVAHKVSVIVGGDCNHFAQGFVNSDDIIIGHCVCQAT